MSDQSIDMDMAMSMGEEDLLEFQMGGHGTDH